jgi:hypothetical protein
VSPFIPWEERPTGGYDWKSHGFVWRSHAFLWKSHCEKSPIPWDERPTGGLDFSRSYLNCPRSYLDSPRSGLDLPRFWDCSSMTGRKRCARANSLSMGQWGSGARSTQKPWRSRPLGGSLRSLPHGHPRQVCPPWSWLRGVAAPLVHCPIEIANSSGGTRSHLQVLRGRALCC